MPHWWVSGQGWIDERGNCPVRPRKQHHALVWPIDRPQTGHLSRKWGRLKDIFTGKGPDIFLATNPNRPVHVTDGPTRRRWTNCPELENNDHQRVLDSANWKGDMFRPPHKTKRPPHKKYDFATRRYQNVHPHLVCDVERIEGYRYPVAYEVYGQPNDWQRNHPIHGYRTTDPRNFGQNRRCNGEFGMGGYYHPAVDGWP